MAYRITNNAPGPRGIWSAGTLIWLDPGQTKTFEPDSIRAVRRNPSFAVDLAEAIPELPADVAAMAKGKATNPAVDMTLKKAELIKIARREKVEIETDDNKADLVRKINAARK